MKCEDFKIKMLDEIMGEISIEESLLLEEHLRECDECRREYERVERTIEILKSSRDSEPPPYLREKILRRLEFQRKRSPIWSLLNTPVKLYHAIVIVLLSLFLYAFVGKVLFSKKVPPPPIARRERFIPEKKDTLFKFYTAPTRLPYRL